MKSIHWRFCSHTASVNKWRRQFLISWSNRCWCQLPTWGVMVSPKTWWCKTNTFVGLFGVFCLHVHRYHLCAGCSQSYGLLSVMVWILWIESESPGRAAMLLSALSLQTSFLAISVLSLRLSLFLCDIGGQSLLVFILGGGQSICWHEPKAQPTENLSWSEMISS